MKGSPGIPKKPFEIYNEHFSNYVTSLVMDMTDAQRAALPYSISKKAFLQSGFRSDRLTFGELSQLAITAFNKRIVILVDSDDDSATTIDTLKDALLVQRRKKPLHEVAEKMQTDAMFVLADRELIEATLSLRLVAQSQVWRHLLTKAKKLPKAGKNIGFRERRAVIKAMASLLCKYDSLKAVLPGEFGVSLAEWYALLFFFEGEKTPGEYRRMFKSTPGGKRGNLKKATQRLTRVGLLAGRGRARTQVYSLTAKGDELVIRVLERLFIQPIKAIKQL